VLNVHASLLPRWRGAAPIPAAILAGDAATGATIMQVVLALDAGPMLDEVRVPIGPRDTTATLTPRIAEAGAELLLEVLPRYASGALTARPQDDTLATYAPQIEKDDARIDWAQHDAVHIERMVRGYNPWPMAWTTLDGAPLRIVEAVAGDGPDAAPCTVALVSTDMRFADSGGVGFAVRARDGWLGVSRVQPAGGRVMAASAFVNGHRDIVGKRLGG
jgi:methionyl-tRNA formyltransferase